MVGPHTSYALAGRMLITGLSNNRDHGGKTGMVEYTNAGEYITTHWMPTDEALDGAVKSGQFADGYGYDVIVHKYDAELSAIDGQVIVEFIGKRLGMFGLLRDAKAHVKSLI